MCTSWNTCYFQIVEIHIKHSHHVQAQHRCLNVLVQEKQNCTRPSDHDISLYKCTYTNFHPIDVDFTAMSRAWKMLPLYHSCNEKKCQLPVIEHF